MMFIIAPILYQRLKLFRNLKHLIISDFDGGKLVCRWDCFATDYVNDAGMMRFCAKGTKTQIV